MSVRGTSHALAQKKVVNLDRGGTFVACAWDECDRDGFELFKVRAHEHPPTWACEQGSHVTFVFCSERHKLFWLHSSGKRARDLEARYDGRVYGMLPPGTRRTVL